VHPGIVGTAPDAKLLARWNKREGELLATAPDRVPPLASPPDPNGALVGALTGPHAERVLREGARSVPPREQGGNCDIKNLSRGSRLYLPVFVKGANLSVGDLHFSQGDGEITFCGGIEMAGYIDLHVDLIKDGVNKYGIANPIFKPGPLDPRFSEFLVFEGISVDDKDKQHYLDPFIAYQRACLNAVEYFTRFGFTPQQVYLLLGTAPVEGRISGIVDVPNACCTLYVPTEIFDFDVMPCSDGPKVASRGQEARPT
jgi:formamidase